MVEFFTVYLIKYLPRFLTGTGLTIQLTAASIVFGSVLGLLFAIIKVARVPGLRHVASLYTWVFRGTPLLVQILLWNSGLWEVGLKVQPGIAAVIALSTNAGAYITEIVRAGIESIDRGQMEAARSLGMSYSQAMRRVILPQTYKRLLPPMSNEFIAMLKDSSLVSAISMVELMRTAQLINSSTYKAMEGFFAAAIFYLIMTSVFTVLANYLERKVGVYEA